MPSKQCDHLQILKKERKEENPNVSFIIFFLSCRKCYQPPAKRTSDQNDWSSLYRQQPNVTIQFKRLHTSKILQICS